MMDLSVLQQGSSRVKKTAATAILALALIASGCAASESVDGQVAESKPAVETSTTVAAEPAATSTTSTTQAPAVESTTTTAVDKGELSEVDALLASIKTGDEITSGRVEGTISMTGLDGSEGGPSDITMAFTTAFDTATGNSSMLMDTSSLVEGMETDPDDPFAEIGAAMLGEMEFRQVGDRGYMRAGFFSLMLGNETEWISMPADDGGDFATDFEAAPTDPHELLGTYEGAAADVEDLGEESVNGTTATHYRVSIDATAFLAELSAEERAEAEASGVLAIGILPIDLWITDEGYLVRMILEIDGSDVESADGKFESMKLSFDMFDINRSVSIEAPPANQVTAIEDLEMGGFDFGITAADI